MYHQSQHSNKHSHNQRLHKRYRCNQPVAIYHRHQLIGKSLVKNISQEGLLFELSRHIVAIQKGAIIEISFFSLYNKRQINFPAFVVHRQPDAIGVWLDGEDKILKRYIDCMLKNITRFV
ncbi:hypothetical protein AB835_01450 [Candidatus Endobugula sertula]|uniref:PilZ domain-containing protein n=1 Tax=Candidatus Endobugula sertula TaxID=62101 RepID=A0A1D2QTT9_9GAMM|nr:hypothetical protein AB835_01450 [Candidatus Endobugula sertula]